MRRSSTCIALVMLLSACQGPASLPALVRRAAAGAAASPGRPAATGKPTALPAAPAKQPAAAATPRPPIFLKQPSSGASVLSGTVALDGSYAVRVKSGHLISQDGAGVLAAGDAVVSNDGGSLISQDGAGVVSNDGGSVVSNDGGSVVSNDGGSVVSNDGGSVVSNDGGSIIAQAAGNVIVPAALTGPDGAGLISQDGGGLISKDGAGVVSNDGGSVVSNDGGSLVAHGSGSLAGTHARRVLDASCPADGALPAAAGMAIYVRSLVTGKPVPIGVDAVGKAVYAVYTNLKGEYQLFLPPALNGNVEVAALVPRRANPHLRLRNLVALGQAPATRRLLAAGTGANVDEDTTVMADDLAAAFRPLTLAIVHGQTDVAMTALGYDQGDPLILGPAREAIGELTDLARQNGCDRLDPAHAEALARRMVDIVLSQAKLDEATVAHDDLVQRTGVDLCASEAIPVLVAYARNRRAAVQGLFDRLGPEAAIAKLEASRTLQAHPLADGSTFQFVKPADYGRFALEALVGSNIANFDPIHQALIDFDTEADLQPAFPTGANWLLGALNAVMTHVGMTIFTNQAVHDQLVALLQGQGNVARP